MNKKRIIILTIIILIFTIIAGFIIYLPPIDISFKTAFTKSHKGKSILNDYTTTVTKFNDYNAILFQRVISSTADNTNTYFKADILIVTQDKNAVKNLKKKHQLAVLIMTNSLSNFKGNDVNSIAGKTFLKETIKRELEKKFGYGTIRAIYFENFIRG